MFSIFKGKTIKHRNNTDVAFAVIEEKQELSGVFCKGIWINIAYKEPFVMADNRGPLTEEIFITNEQMTNWKELDE